ncbi:MAG: ATP-binding cassette subfamily B bacterial [Erysipelotrichaceae bacterium]|nr:MAG: ATP-binding cassette subfamily B bacterial [Erysipelotrichaceae bacterium]
MIRLKKYLKPFIAAIGLAIGLLFVQASADLNLPKYMSNIVSIGIQQKGVANASPEALSLSGYDLIYTLATAAQKETLNSSYTLISDPSQENLKKYPNIAGKDFYLLNSNITKLQREAGQGSNGGPMSIGSLDITKLYQAIPGLKMLPAAVLGAAQSSSSDISDTLKKQTGVVLAQAFYTDLGVDLESMQMKYIFNTGLMMLLITLIGAVAMILVVFLSSRIGAALSRNLRKDIFKKVESFSNEEFDTFASSSLITRTTNDVTQVQMLITIGIRILFYAPILAIGGIYMILQTNVSMVWIIALAVVLLLMMIAGIFTVAVPKFKLTQKLIDRLNLVAREGLSGLMVVRAFGNQKFEAKRFDKANRNLADTLLFVNRVMNLLMPFMMLIMNLTVVLIVWVGAHQIADSNLQIGDMLAFMQYAMQVIMGFLMISMVFIIFPRAQVSAVRIADVLAVENKIVDLKDPKHFDAAQTGVVEFKNVSFKYANAVEDVLHNVSFKALPGQTTAFIGSTGSGKSTLINLIPRFYDVTEGSITVNGVDVRHVTQHDLHDTISYIPQKGMLLSGSVNFNLKYGKRDATEEEVLKAASIAQAVDFISQKEEGFESNIAQAGANVSGGQKQRLSIARALVKNAPIIIFDDSFSALDFKTDQHKELRQSTLLIVAQRVSTIMNADQIIVLEDGKIVGQGTHRELLTTCPIYYEIASSQLSQEELAL